MHKTLITPVKIFITDHNKEIDNKNFIEKVNNPISNSINESRLNENFKVYSDSNISDLENTYDLDLLQSKLDVETHLEKFRSSLNKIKII